MNLSTINFSSLLPVLILSVFGIAIMVAEPFLRQAARLKLGWLGLAGVVAAMVGLGPMSGQKGQWYSNLWIVDEYSLFFHAVFLFIAAMTILGSVDFLNREKMNHAEYYALLLFATAGMLLMAGSNDLMLIFLGIEILSIATYVLAGFRRTDLKSNESALKYFLLGSFSSAFFLYGVALMFGGTGSTNLMAIADALITGNADGGLVYLGAALMLVALCFKVAVAPFHIWTPDVYEGAPTPVTGFMSVAPKAAGFAVLLRIYLTALPAIQDRWTEAMWVVAALTMLLGNAVAVVQPNIKRMLAYSSIAHAGYIAVAFTAHNPHGMSAAMFYTFAYSAMNLGAFTVVTILSRSEDKMVNLEDYAGLARKHPVLAALLSLFLLSLAGIPLTSGFAGKFFIFRSAVESGMIWLAVIGVLSTVVSFYYYLYVIVQMYMRDPKEEFADVRITPGLRIALFVAAVTTIYLGILPERLLDWTVAAADFALR